MTASKLGQSLERHNGQPSSPVRAALERQQAQLAAALPKTFPGGAERFARIVLTAVNRDPKLLQCDVRTVLGAAMQCAQLGLTPNLLGEAWIIPYGAEATFQVGYKGLVKLAGQAGVRVVARAVHERDEFSFGYGLDGDQLTHRPAVGDRGPAYLWYAIARTTDGAAEFAVIDRDHVERRRKAGKGANSPAWQNWYSEMALGKAVREVLRFVPLSTEQAQPLAAGLRLEETVRAIEPGAKTDTLDDALVDAPEWDDDAPVDAEIVEPSQ